MRQMSMPGDDLCQSSRREAPLTVTSTRHTDLRNHTMSPVAAYFLFVAQENERELAQKQPWSRAPRPSLLQRATRFAASLSPVRLVARAA
jgi:hypothetical protein